MSARTTKSTKTGKKPTAKNTKKSVKKTAAKAASAKTAVKAKATKPAKAKIVLTPLERIRQLNLLSAVIYAFLAVVTLVLLAPVSARLNLHFQAQDNFANAPGVVLAPAVEKLADLEFRHFLAFILLLAAIGSVLLATKLQKRYEKSIKNETAYPRWILFGITGGLMLEFVALLAGVNDIATLKLIAALVFLASILFWISERDNKGARSPNWLAYGLGLLAGAVAWVPILASLVGTPLFGMERFGWHVYAVLAVVLLGSAGVAVLQRRRISGLERNYESLEEKYLRLALGTDLAVVLILLAALQK